MIGAYLQKYATPEGFRVVYSPDDASLLTVAEANKFRETAFGVHNNFNWVIEQIAAGGYRVQAGDPTPGTLREGVPAVSQPTKSSRSPSDVGYWNHPKEG